MNPWMKQSSTHSRPTISLSSDPADYKAFTPGHFLVGSPLTLLPETDHSEVPLNRLRHYINTITISTDLAKMKYWPQMQRRERRISSSRKSSIGNLVILWDNSLPLIRWHLVGVKIATWCRWYMMIWRVVIVRNSSGQEFRRLIEMIALLTTQKDNDQDVVEN